MPATAVPDRSAARRLDPRVRRALTATLAAAAAGGGDGDMARLRFTPEDAGYLPVLAEGHGVAALAVDRLLPTLPAAAGDALADAAARTRARGLRLAADWSEVAAALTAGGVPFAPLKWAALAGRLYGDATRRPAADLDVLVPAPFGETAAAVLRGLGYAAGDVTWKHRVYLRPGNRAVSDMRGEHADNPRPVELHLRLREAFRGIALDLTDMADVATPATRLPFDVHLLHLAAHATVDALGRRLRLIHLLDLARLAGELNAAEWASVMHTGASPQAARFIWPALDLAARTTRATVPPAVRAALSSQVSPALDSWLQAADIDAVSWFGRDTTARALDEVPAMWPLSGRERLTVWRFIVLPERWALADRYPRLARSSLWPLMYVRHVGYSGRLLWRRWLVRAT